MTEEEMVRLYLQLSSQFENLDPQVRELLHRLENEMFDVMTIAQIEAVQQRVSGEL